MTLNALSRRRRPILVQSSTALKISIRFGIFPITRNRYRSGLCWARMFSSRLRCCLVVTVERGQHWVHHGAEQSQSWNLISRSSVPPAPFRSPPHPKWDQFSSVVVAAKLSIARARGDLFALLVRHLYRCATTESWLRIYRWGGGHGEEVWRWRPTLGASLTVCGRQVAVGSLDWNWKLGKQFGLRRWSLFFSSFISGWSNSQNLFDLWYQKWALDSIRFDDRFFFVEFLSAICICVVLECSQNTSTDSYAIIRPHVITYNFSRSTATNFCPISLLPYHCIYERLYY